MTQEFAPRPDFATRPNQWMTVVAGHPLDQSPKLQDVQQFVRAAPPDGLGIEMDVEALTALLMKIDADPAARFDVPPQLRGVSGWAGLVALNKALVGIDCLLFGKIRNYIYVPDARSGHLSVDVWIHSFHEDRLPKYRLEFQHWDIEILEGFDMHERDDSSRDNPFPTVDLDLPAQAKDPSNPNGIWARGLNRKIHARGTAIEVHRVYQRIGKGPLHLLDPGHHYYQSTEESCVDLFLTDYPPAIFPPTTFGELPPQVGYCLGRCAHPPIVNTGGGE